MRAWLKGLDPSQVLAGAVVVDAEYQKKTDRLVMDLDSGHRVVVQGHDITVLTPDPEASP